MRSEPPLILVVEDDANMRRLLRTTLESNDMRYVEAVTVRGAL
jgi:CheY-like chemotaxis protein